MVVRNAENEKLLRLTEHSQLSYRYPNDIIQTGVPPANLLALS